MKFTGGWIRGFAVLLVTVFLAGCASHNGQFKFDPLTASGGAPAPSATTPVMSNPLTPVSGTSAAAAAGLPAQPQIAAITNGGPILYPGDGVTVAFQDLPSPMPAIDALVQRDGTVTLMYNKVFQAAGKTSGQLAQDIRAAYVPSYFVNMTPVIAIKDRFYYVTGEVKSPGRQVYIGRMTVLDAIATAGGLTDFSRKGAIWLYRADGKTRETINYAKALEKSELNLEVFPNDRVHVRKRWW